MLRIHWTFFLVLWICWINFLGGLSVYGSGSGSECSNATSNCECADGFTGNGTNCEDVDECADMSHECDEGVNCTNTVGDYNCTCDPGFVADERRCNDIDECSDGSACHDDANCTNFPSSYNCSCKAGFTGNGTVCTDIDECSSGVTGCHDDGECTNFPSSYNCFCKTGFTGNGTYCTDIDECIEGNDCHEDANCTNFLSSYNCSCKAGFTGNGTLCTDVNECVVGSHNCHITSNSSCVNGIGGFTCTCDAGFTGNRTYCQDIDECTDGSNKCGEGGNCTNIQGSYECVCYPGFTGNGKNCSDIDECLGEKPCHEDANCMNFLSSYNCSCNAGFTGNGTFCTVHVGAPTISNIGISSFQVDVLRPDGVGAMHVKISPKHATEQMRTVPTNGSVTVEALTDSTIYWVTANGENSKGEPGIDSNVTEIRTLPGPPMLHLSKPTSDAVMIFFDAKDVMSISKWMLQYRISGENIVSAKNTSVTYGVFWLSNLTADTDYELRARAHERLGEIISYSAEVDGYSPWSTFKTDPLVVFGRVTLKNLNYTAGYSIVDSMEWKDSLQLIRNSYERLSFPNISIVEIEKIDDKPVVHYKLEVNDSTLLSETNYTLSGFDFSDSNINHGENLVGKPIMRVIESNFTLEYQTSTSSCNGTRAHKYFMATSEHSKTIEIHLNGSNYTNVQESIGFAENGISIDDGRIISSWRKNTIYGLSPRFLIKGCTPGGRNSSDLVYAEYFAAIDQDNKLTEAAFYTTDPTPYDVENISYSSSFDGTFVVINVPAMKRAVKYELLNATNVVSELNEHETDGSAVMKIRVAALTNLTVYNFNLKITLRRSDGSTFSTNTTGFNIVPDSEQCSACVEDGRGAYCVRKVFENITCLCDFGYTWTGDIICEDVDECAEKNSKCHKDATCENLPGSYNCTCNLGFIGDAVTSCDDVDECNTTNECHEHANCSNSIGSYSCTCRNGFSGNGTQCEDIDECIEVNDCHVYANCTNFPSSYNCSCKAGFIGNGTLCTDIDECSGKNDCHEESECMNFPSSYNCSCRAGFTGNGTLCTDIDECLNESSCHEYANCTNFPSSYNCSCKAGFTGNGILCTDINECYIGNYTCHENATCKNVPGDYTCQCNQGFTGSGKICTDIDECADNTTCHQDATCENFIGTHSCTCNDGFLTIRENDCADIDECSNDTYNDCHLNATCNNSPGTYNCTCNVGHTGNGTYCEDINECLNITTNDCDGNATCNNTMGSYYCSCNPGFNGTGFVCEDINECIPYPCERYDSSECANLINDYTCSCRTGFTGDAHTVCGRTLEIRLSGRHRERTRNRGYLEMLGTPNRSDWRTICNSGWGENESRAACNMLNYTDASFLPPDIFPYVDPINETWVDNIKCKDNEEHLPDCTTGIFGSSSCKIEDRVKIHCTNTFYNWDEDYAEMVYETPDGDFTFHCKPWEADRMIESQETCESDGRSAAIECKKKLGTEKTMDFEYMTFKEFRCNATLSGLLSAVEIDTVESVLGDLSAITENRTSNYSSEDEPFQVPDIINKLYEKLNQTGENKMQEKPSIFYLMWALDNFNLILNNQIQIMNGTEDFDDNKKLQFVMSLNGIASLLRLTDDNVTIEKETATFKAVKTNKSHLVFEGFASGNKKVRANITTTLKDNGDEVYTYVYLHNNSTIFPQPKGVGITVREVLSVEFSSTSVKNSTIQEPKEPVIQVQGGKIQELEEPRPPEITFTHEKDKNHKGTTDYFQCAHLDRGNAWKSDECKPITVTKNATECNCPRRPSIVGFSVLVKTFSVEDSLALSMASNVGCIVSTAALLIMLIVYLSFRPLRTNQINQIHMHLSLCLITTYLTFLLCIERKSTYLTCMSSTAVLHFALLSAWGWMLVESFTMYRKFVMIFSSTSDKYVVKCALVVYAVSGSVVAANLVTAFQLDAKLLEGWAKSDTEGIAFRPSMYIADTVCWLHSYSLYVGFLTPIAIILVLNLVAIVLITKTIVSTGARVRSSNSKDDAKEHVIRTLMIAMILGIPWISGIPLTLTDLKTVHEIFGWIFTILAAYQGVFIFLLFCVRRKEVRTLCVEKLNKAIETRRESYLSATNSTATSTLSVNPKIYHETALTGTSTEFKARRDAGDLPDQNRMTQY